MSNEKLFDNLETLLKISIPISIVLARTFLPLQPVYQQGLILVLLIWIYMQILTHWLERRSPTEKELLMEKNRFLWTPEIYRKSISALATVAGTTLILLLIGRDKLGETVIALLFVVPIGWSTAKWGQGPGVIAAVTAALAFDFFFIPPFYTFNVGSMEGWMVLIIFLAVSLVVVGHIQVNLSKAQASEREAIFMYEITSALANSQTHEAVAHTVARFIEQRYLPSMVDVTVYDKKSSKAINAHQPQDGVVKNQPECIIPVLNSWGLVCEIRIWHGRVTLPSSDSRLFRNLAVQIGQTLERVRLAERETRVDPNLNVSANQ
jgi:hypothetical protein